MYNLYNLEANSSITVFLQNFKRFLAAEKVAPITLRSYLSDVRFFLKWVYSFLLSNKQIEADSQVNSVMSKINGKVLSAYGSFLQDEEIPIKSVNRKFSALRKLGSFCLAQKLLFTNVFESLKNINTAIPFPEKTYRLGEWTAELNRRRMSKITVKNYLSDVKQYLAWKKSKI